MLGSVTVDLVAAVTLANARPPLTVELFVLRIVIKYAHTVASRFFGDGSATTS